MSEEPMMLGVIIKGLVRALHDSEAVLADFEHKARFEDLQDDEPYPLSHYFELCDYLEERLGVYAFLRAGRRMATAVMDSSFPPELSTVADAIAHLDKAHEALCTPAIGDFELVESGPGRAVVRYTANFNCILQEGLFYELAQRYGAKDATVEHAQCRRDGADACRFELRFNADR